MKSSNEALAATIVPFHVDEYTRRWERLQSALGASDLDALLVTSQTNFEYITGFKTPSWLIKSRPLIVIVPAAGEPIAVVSATHADELVAESPVRQVRTYSGFEREATDRLVATLMEEGLAAGRLGVEAGTEQRIGLPLNEFRRLEVALPKAALRDASAALWKVRMLKSESEISRLREAGRITGEVYEALLEDIRPGWTERQVYRFIVMGAVRKGADAPGYITMTAGPGAYERRNAWPHERPFDQGELFWVDVAGTFGSYYSDYTRCAAIGAATGEQRDSYKVVLEMLDEACAAVRPGAAARSIMDAANKAAGRRGAKLRVASRIGHGVGLDLTEPPSLGEEDEAVLEAGMVLAVEPGILADHGWYHLEENVVVREGACEFLSAHQPRELPVALGD